MTLKCNHFLVLTRVGFRNKRPKCRTGMVVRPLWCGGWRLGAISGVDDGHRTILVSVTKATQVLFNIVHVLCMVFPTLIYLAAYVDVKCQRLWELLGSHSMFSDVVCIKLHTHKHIENKGTSCLSLCQTLRKLSNNKRKVTPIALKWSSNTFLTSSTMIQKM